MKNKKDDKGQAGLNSPEKKKNKHQVMAQPSGKKGKVKKPKAKSGY